jgi:7,8-dihydro-6-hydroxymethylpterin dimethyltransferase
MDKSWGLTGNQRKKYGSAGPERTIEDAKKRRTDKWNFQMIAGMWFQDLFNYDFRRTEMCIIPYATQQGEISFCAYNTGIGWRKIIENMYKNATVAQWYKEHGKHEIYAKGRNVSLETYEHSLVVNPEDASRVRHLDTEVPNTAAEENRARRRADFLKEEARVRKMYEELVLKQTPQEVVQIGSLGDIKKATPAVNPVQISNAKGKGAAKPEVAEHVAGD